MALGYESIVGNINVQKFVPTIKRKSNICKLGVWGVFLNVSCVLYEILSMMSEHNFHISHSLSQSVW